MWGSAWLSGNSPRQEIVDFLRRLMFKTANLPYVFRIVFGLSCMVFTPFFSFFWRRRRPDVVFFVAVVFAVVGGIPPACRHRRRLAVFIDRPFLLFVGKLFGFNRTSHLLMLWRQRIFWGGHVLRCEKSFCEIFREVFAKFFKVFASFLRFSPAFRGFRIHSDPLGCIRMHSEAIGSVWTFSNIFEIFWSFQLFSTFLDIIFTKDFFTAQ